MRTEDFYRHLVETFGGNAARRAAGITEESPLFAEPEGWLAERWFALAKRFDEFREAAYEAVEILEDLYEHEREAGKGWKLAAADYYGKTLDLKAKNRELTQGLNETADAWREACVELVNVRSQLRTLHEDYAKLRASRDYADDRLAMLRERIKTYRATLQDIARYSKDGGATLAYHVLNSRIDDGGSDF